MTRPTHRRLRNVALACLGWLVVIVAGYYVVHKPVDPTVALALATSVRDLTLGAAILTLAGGLGRRLLSDRPREPLAGLALECALGLGSLSLGLLALGVAGLLRPAILWGAAILVGWVLRSACRDWLRQFGGLGAAIRQGGALGRATAALAAVAGGAALLEALAPAVHFDALVYHLVLPLDFLRTGSISYAGGSPYWGMPLSAELLYTWATALGDLETAAVLGWCVGIVALVGVLGVGRRFGRRAGWGAVAALACGETLVASLGWAYADWFVALFGVGLVVAIDAWADAPSPARAAMAGVLAGLAVGVKYTALAGGLAAGIVLVAVPAVRRRGWCLAAYAAAAVLTTLPWLLKNFLYAGAPLFPFYGDTPWVSAFQQQWFRGGTPGASWLASLFTPIRATLLGVEGAPGPAASLGPLLLGLVPGALLVRRSAAGRARRLAVFVVAGWAIWSLGAAVSPQLLQTRLYYVLFPAWGALAGAGYTGIARIRVGRVRLRRLAEVLIVLALALATVGQVTAVFGAGAPAAALGLETEEVYLARRLGAYLPAMQAVAALAPGSRVLYLWEARGLHCRPNCIPDYWIDRWAAGRQESGSAQQILEAWRSQGVDHVLLHRAGAAYVRSDDRRYTPADWAVLEEVLEDLGPGRAIGDGYTLFEVPR